MASRWMQQKKAKQKRMRRAWAKPFSMKNTGPMKSPGFLNEKGDFVDIGFGSRTKIARSAPNFDTMSQFLLKTFKYDSPEAIYARTSGLHTDLAQDRQIVLAKMSQSSKGGSHGSAGSLQGEQRYVYQSLKKEPNYELRLYISGDSCFFALEMTTDKERIYKLSVEYDGKHRAMDDHVHRRYLWDKVKRTKL